MANRQIKCIRQYDWKERHERITHVGGDWGRITSEEAINDIEKDIHTYHVKVGYNDVQVDVIKHQSGKKYLRTRPDGTTKDNLLELPTCP